MSKHKRTVEVEIGISDKDNTLCEDCDFMEYIDCKNEDNLDFRCIAYNNIQLDVKDGRGYKRCEACLKGDVT